MSKLIIFGLIILFFSVDVLGALAEGRGYAQMVAIVGDVNFIADSRHIFRVSGAEKMRPEDSKLGDQAHLVCSKLLNS